MSWLRFFRRRRADAEVQHEIESYLEEEAAENVARGMKPDEAWRQARIKLGSPQRVRETLWRQNSIAAVDSAWRDLRYAARTLTRSPGFTATAILVMALGIGANTALFTVVHSVLMTPLPFRDPARLVDITDTDAHSATLAKFPVPSADFFEWQKQSHGFAAMALEAERSYNLSGSAGQLPEKVSAQEASWDLFPMLGVNAALGRVFTESDDSAGASATAVITWGLWKRRYGADPHIVGRTISLDSKIYTVIGILPSWFSYPNPVVQLWTPVRHEETGFWFTSSPWSHYFQVVARLKPGVSEGEGQAELSAIQARIRKQDPTGPVSDATVVTPLLESEVGKIKPALYMLCLSDVSVIAPERSCGATIKVMEQRLISHTCRWIFAAFLSAALSPRLIAQSPTITATTDLVVVPALVRESSGGLVQFLSASDFVLTDNDVPQNLTLDDVEGQPLSVVVLMQTGASAPRHFRDYAKLGTVLTYLVANRLHQIAMVTFDSRPEEQWDFTANIADLQGGFARPDPGDAKAAILDAVNYGIDLLRKQPEKRRRIIILLSQTHDEGSLTHAEDIIKRLGESNITIECLAFSPEKAWLKDQFTQKRQENKPYQFAPNIPPLLHTFNLDKPLRVALSSLRENTSASIAQMSGGESLPFATRSELEQQLSTVANHLAATFTLSFRPTSKESGFHSLQLRIAGLQSSKSPLVRAIGHLTVPPARSIDQRVPLSISDDTLLVSQTRRAMCLLE